MDESQDYDMLHGYDNGTHTVIRFRRRYDTCDSDDYRITNDTMRILYSYHVAKMDLEGSLPYHGPHHRGSRTLYLFDRLNLQEHIPEETFIWELRNSAGTIPIVDDRFYWCKMFRLPNLQQKHHMIRYEALVSSSLQLHITYIVVYECHGNVTEMEAHVRFRGHVCHQPSVLALLSNHCNNVVMAWGTGSEGFNFPLEAGYPLDPVVGPKYFMMETHYAIPPQDGEDWENSGIRVYYTASLRENDAGVISVGLDPNWRHIIPPGQADVVSEGHCISACTQHSIPPTGINMFAVAFHTHQIGRKVRLRHLREEIELPLISQDNKYYYNYQEFRRLLKPAVIHQGDHLIAECEYNSIGRSTITLGGLTSREEMCLVFGYYFPRIDLSLCHSLPSLPTVLHSLGIQELWRGSSPVRIKSPQELADMTLENRLVTYDWEKNFRSFQDATHRGSFKPLCWIKKPKYLPGTVDTEEFYPNITHHNPEPSSCTSRKKKPRRRKKPGEEDNTSHSREMYNSISVHESSRLNNVACILTPSTVLLLIVLSLR